MNLQNIESSEEKIPFSDAIRSETHVLETTRKTTASSCAPCLSSIVGTWNEAVHTRKNVLVKWSTLHILYKCLGPGNVVWFQMHHLKSCLVLLWFVINYSWTFTYLL